MRVKGNFSQYIVGMEILATISALILNIIIISVKDKDWIHCGI